jgi:hypothetical protein
MSVQDRLGKKGEANRKTGRDPGPPSDDKDARSMADRCGEIAALLEATSAYQRLRARDPCPWSREDRVLRIASGAPLTRREIRLAGMFALAWFAMDVFWFISTVNHWFGL